MSKRGVSEVCSQQLTDVVQTGITVMNGYHHWKEGRGVRDGGEGGGRLTMCIGLVEWERGSAVGLSIFFSLFAQCQGAGVVP